MKEVIKHERKWISLRKVECNVRPNNLLNLSYKDIEKYNVGVTGSVQCRPRAEETSCVEQQSSMSTLYFTLFISNFCFSPVSHSCNVTTIPSSLTPCVSIFLRHPPHVSPFSLYHSLCIHILLFMYHLPTYHPLFLSLFLCITLLYETHLVTSCHFINLFIKQINFYSYLSLPPPASVFIDLSFVDLEPGRWRIAHPAVHPSSWWQVNWHQLGLG